MKKKIIISIFMSFACSIVFGICAFAGEWVQDGASWKYKNDDGTYVVSDWKFLKYGNNYAYFYFDELGNMCTGLKKIGSNYHSFNADGSANSNSHVTVGGVDYNTRNKGVLTNVFKELDVDAYNREFAYANRPKTAAEIASEAEAKALIEEAEQAAAVLAAEEELRGPKSRFKKIVTNKNSGPGVELK